MAARAIAWRETGELARRYACGPRAHWRSRHEFGGSFSAEPGLPGELILAVLLTLQRLSAHVARPRWRESGYGSRLLVLLVREILQSTTCAKRHDLARHVAV